MEKPKELTAVEAARQLGVGLDYLYSLLWTGKLLGHKVRGAWRVPVSAVEERQKAKEASHRTPSR
jgi:excisionase family DNA binding protein